MTTAVDTNVLLDLLAGGSTAISNATSALSGAAVAGPVTVCPVVYAELRANFADEEEQHRFLADLGIRLEQFTLAALREGALAWRAYVRRRGGNVQCARCGNSFALPCPSCQEPVSWRQHIISDFLIGGHAQEQAHRLLTRDSGYYRTYFPRLQLVDPGRPRPTN